VLTGQEGAGEESPAGSFEGEVVVGQGEKIHVAVPRPVRIVRRTVVTDMLFMGPSVEGAGWTKPWKVKGPPGAGAVAVAYALLATPAAQPATFTQSTYLRVCWL
jgi:hypothetical protein